MNRKIGIIFSILLGVVAASLYWGLRGGDGNPPMEQITIRAEGRIPSLILFQEWLAAPVQDYERGIMLAKERGAIIRDLIRTDPEQAIRKALSLAEWSGLPPEIKAYVEQPFSTLANVEVLISCGKDSSETIVTTEFPASGKMETFVYGRRTEVGSKIGIPVQGIRMGDIGALREAIFQPLEAADEAVALQLFPVAISDPGGDSVAALAGGSLFYFETRAALDEANSRLAALEELPGPNAGAQALFESLEAYLFDGSEIDFEALEGSAYAAAEEWTGTPRDMYVILCDFSDSIGQPADPVVFSNALNNAVSQQIWEMSYEKTHIIGIVNPTTYRLPSPSSSYTNDSSQLHTDAKALAIGDGVDLSPYETVCVLFPNVDDIGWAGLASVGGIEMWLNGTINNDVVIHELGHNYGARHASSWTNSVSSNPVEPAPAGGKIEYGDFMDILGSGDGPEGHFNVWHKKNIIWFDAENWKAVGSSGSYRIYRSDHYQTTGLLRGLEIDKGASDTYWVGLRQEYPAYDSYSRGAYLLWKKFGHGRSYLLDTSPLSAGGEQDGGLALGQTYSDPAAQVHITPTARGGQTPNEWMDITVNLGAFGGNSAPMASISGPLNGAVQESMLFSVTASDTDGDELAYYWDTGDDLVKPNAPSISATWLYGSTVTVSCVVSDMKGGTNKVSHTVALSSPLGNWTQRTSGTALNLKDIAFGGGRLVAVSREDTTVYSDDGTNWTSHQNFDVASHNVYLEAITYDGYQFIAVGMDHDSGWEQTTYTSPTGISWTERYDSDSGSASNVRLYDVAYGSGVYIAVGDNGTIVRSTDGLSWNPVASGTSTDLYGVSYGDSTFVIVGDEGGSTAHVVLTSTNGLSWADHSSGSSITDNQWMFEVEYVNDRFLAAGGFRSGIQYSTDQGQSFLIGADDDYEIDGFAYGGGVYLATGVYSFTGRSEDINLISADGVNWSELPTVQKDNQNAAIAFNGTFITVGDNGSIWQSDAVEAVEMGYANWQLENEVSLGLNRDPLEDADFDGSVNLIEYALGSTATDASSVPSSSTATTGSYFHVSYDRDSIKSDIDYNVERLTNLVSNDWSTANTITLEDSTTNLAVRSAFTILSQTNEFMRLNIGLK